MIAIIPYPRYLSTLLVLMGPVWLRADTFDTLVRPLLKEYCVACHSTKELKGELDLERISTIEQAKQQAPVWESVLEQLANREMPPKDEPQLSPDQKTQLTNWIRGMLDEVAMASANDPGPVVLRRLSNHEYTYTIRDLTGVESLDPANEFPVDGAAGEGFTNAGAGLVMSPSLLTKYLDAAKEVSDHAMLLPDGIRFSPSTTSRDWTDETLKEIRDFYNRFAAPTGGSAMNLQGVTFETNSGGRLDVAKYLAALVAERDALRSGKPLAEVATSRGLNEKYLTTLWQSLVDTQPSLALNDIRRQFLSATAENVQSLTEMVQDRQKSLWRFASVGHIGKVNGPKSWQEPVTPIVARHEMRLKLAPPADGSDLQLYMTTFDAGDGNDGDFVLWDNARLVIPGRMDLPLKHVRGLMQQVIKHREAVISTVKQCLAAAHEIQNSKERTDVANLSSKYRVDPGILTGWLDFVGIGSAGDVNLGPLLTGKLDGTSDYSFIKGWTGADALSVLANSSDSGVRIPGTMKPHSVATHPSPAVATVTAWRSPLDGKLSVRGTVQDVHTDCGNGVTWSLEVRRGNTSEILASGVSHGGTLVETGTFDQVQVTTGDVVALVIGPRDGSHVCDLTDIELVISDGEKSWSLAGDVSSNLLESNPHSDSHGNPNVWYFFGEPVVADSAVKVPNGSILSKWLNSTDALEREGLATKIQELISQDSKALDASSPDGVLHKMVFALNGPLFGPTLRVMDGAKDDGSPSPYGLDPSLFGMHPDRLAVDATTLCVKAPSIVDFTLPASLLDGAELVVEGRLHPVSGANGSVQMQLTTTKPKLESGIVESKTETSLANGQWTDNNLRTIYSAPVIANDGSDARHRFESAFEVFRDLFPVTLCYTQIVPVDEVVTLTLFYREDDQLQRLMLSDAEANQLDRLWKQLDFVSEAPLKQVDGFEQLFQFATQDADPSAFEPMREPILRRAEEFSRQLIAAEPNHVQAVIDFASRAWRRPLDDVESAELRTLYGAMRQKELSHSHAVRMLLSRVLVSPAFLYRGEKTSKGTSATPLTDWELATRLSYFLWSSAPDEQLRADAFRGALRDPDALAIQTRRMLKDDKIRRFALEFGCQWLHVRDLATLDEKSERHFPTFLSLRDEMQEEVVRFFVDMLKANRSVLSLLDADHTFVNGELAKHYGIEINGDDWRRIDGLRNRGRGGMLGFAATLAKQSGASRTSPILRGNWLSEVVLGEKLPKPPKGVPVLPEEAPQGLTERQLIEKHSSDATCARCHERIDPFGFALEGFDAIGRVRDKDAAGLVIDTSSTLADGTQLDGLEGVRSYLLEKRREDFVQQFCRKLLGYALGRSVQLSDKPLLNTMRTQLAKHDYQIGTAIELVIRSPQFREVRGNDFGTNQ